MTTTRPRSDAEIDTLIGDTWNDDRMGDLTGRRVLVTGGTRGLGAVVARRLAVRGADVTITGRDAGAAHEAAVGMRSGSGGRVGGPGLDLGSLADVADAARRIQHPVDLLVANAGVMWGPRRETVDGFEHQVGVNAIGHFALVAHLMPRLLDGVRPRIVFVSSGYHRYGRLEARYLDATARDYRPNRAYGTSKLAVLVLARELARRAAAAGAELCSLAAHPGWADTDLQARQVPAWQRPVVRVANALFAAPVERAADSLLCAATLEGLPGGAFIGPGRRAAGRTRGAPASAPSTREANDPAAAAALWRWLAERAGIEPRLEAGDAG